MIEKLRGIYFPVLDKGFVSLVDIMGDDSSIVQAARTSYGKGTKNVSDDRTLIRYLMRHRHTTPYEMVEFKFFLQIPMDAWRQYIRHRTASVNEYSTRYSEAIDLKQETPSDKWRLQSTINKQGSCGNLEKWPEKNVSCPGFIEGCFDQQSAFNRFGASTPGEYLSAREREFHKMSDAIYKERLRFGVAREVARKDLPLSTYTRAYWKIDLHNLFHFLKLRCDSHAQLEIRSYANVIAAIVKECCPLAFEAWYDYSFSASNLTRLDKIYMEWYNKFAGDLSKEESEKECIKFAESIGMSKRELDEFWQKFTVPSNIEFKLDWENAKDKSYYEKMDKK
jgi:thymidylate synthase (FAD)